MKKIISLLLAVTMLLGMSFAMAEEKVEIEQATPDFSVTAVVPEGYQMQEDHQDGTVLLDFTCDKEGTANYIISIAYSEEYDGRTLNDFTDEERKTLLANMDDDFMAADIKSYKTESGTELYLINETAATSDDENTSFAVGFTIYKGYFFQIFAVRDDFDVLTQADLDLAVKILSDIWFVE